ncbi:MAG: T9SS type A sorting domain-containing protein [Bacteroidetes bacterium]|nr:T9SS type A sorting domain-containing protein [Bacteroidota bacterium]
MLICFLATLIILKSASISANESIILTDPTGGKFRGIVDTTLNEFNYIEGKVNVYSQDEYIPPIGIKEPNVYFPNKNLDKLLASVNQTNYLRPGEYFALKVNLMSGSMDYYRVDFKLDAKCQEAMNIAPVWMRNDLLIKFRELNLAKVGNEALYAQLILDAAKDDIKIVDEVAFLVAHIPVETLSNSAFINGDMNRLIADVKHIYTIADSLKYVEIVEHGNYASGDYYTTTRYKHKTSKSATPIWTEIPSEIYYWYVVHPQIYQETIQYTDNPSNTIQRTWGYSYRDFYWSNPDPAHDYKPVNQKTTAGEVVSIPRLGELMQSPEVLFDRDYNLLNFNRPFNEANNTALNVLGNWCSRAVPGDPSSNDFRPIAPNQVLTHHRGRCGEDTQLLVAAARTCLIPIITRITHCEDHVFGAVYDADRWQHFEFFRGGLVPTNSNGTSGWGWTHLNANSTYEDMAPDYWIISTVNGMRPDGYFLNNTEGYTKTCEIVFTVKDKDGNPVAGARVNLHGLPHAFGSDFNPTYSFSRDEYTDRNGIARMLVGDNKYYLYKIYHTGFVGGQYPQPENTYNVAVGGVTGGQLSGPRSQSGMVYEHNIAITNYQIPAHSITNVNDIPATKYAMEINMNISDILVAKSNNRTFHYWSPDSTGHLTYFVVNQTNFDKLQAGQPFEAYSKFDFKGNGKMIIPIPETENDWFVVGSNKSSTLHSQFLNFEASLLVAPEPTYSYLSIEEDYIIENFIVSPNPFADFCKIELPMGTESIEITDESGAIVLFVNANDLREFDWYPTTGNGVYFVRIKLNSKFYLQKIIFNK